MIFQRTSIKALEGRLGLQCKPQVAWRDLQRTGQGKQAKAAAGDAAGDRRGRSRGAPAGPEADTALNSDPLRPERGLPRFGWDTAMDLWGTGEEVAAGWRFM